MLFKKHENAKSRGLPNCHRLKNHPATDGIGIESGPVMTEKNARWHGMVGQNKVCFRTKTLGLQPPLSEINDLLNTYCGRSSYHR